MPKGQPFRDKKRYRTRDDELAEVADQHGTEIAALVARLVEEPAPEHRYNMNTLLTDGKRDDRYRRIPKQGVGAVRRGRRRR